MAFPDSFRASLQTVPELEDRDRVADWIENACRWEVLAPKPGNVRPGASFEDLTADDFLASAEIVAPILAEAGDAGIGRAVVDAVEATQSALGRNTNLGIILLLAPLAAVPLGTSLPDGISDVLAATTVEDARLVYCAIRRARAGGMGEVAEQDLAEEPTAALVDVMRLAADHDRIAAQYASGFHGVLHYAAPQLLNWTARTRDVRTSIVGLHLTLMSRLPDTLIARKCGADVSADSASRAQAVLDAGWPESADGIAACDDFDRWLRADGNRRNPGTTADLIAATLFAAQRDYDWSAD